MQNANMRYSFLFIVSFSFRVMGKYDKPINEFDDCPHCGSDFGYYQQMYVFGWIEDRKTFEGKHDNAGELYDYLHYSRESKFYCCSQCKERIARVGNES